LSRHSDNGVRATSAAVLADFPSIALGAYHDETVAERYDSKFVLAASLVPRLLERCRERYRVLDVNGARITEYQSAYFDTPDRAFYLAHHAGRAPRSKVRVRTYVATRDQVLELKVRTNQGQTRKYRVAVAGDDESTLGMLAGAPFADVDPTLAALPLVGVLRATYHRITLVASPSERVTVDLGLTFTGTATLASARFDRLAIAEVKGSRRAATWFRQLARELGVRTGGRGGMSKYCLGVISLERPTQQGRFRDVLNRISHAVNGNDLSPRDQ
jgi:hypothetical protein